jgi:hypothetical protein
VQLGCFFVWRLSFCELTFFFAPILNIYSCAYDRSIIIIFNMIFSNASSNRHLVHVHRHGEAVKYRIWGRIVYGAAWLTIICSALIRLLAAAVMVKPATMCSKHVNNAHCMQGYGHTWTRISTCSRLYWGECIAYNLSCNYSRAAPCMWFVIAAHGFSSSAHTASHISPMLVIYMCALLLEVLPVLMHHGSHCSVTALGILPVSLQYTVAAAAAAVIAAPLLSTQLRSFRKSYILHRSHWLI